MIQKKDEDNVMRVIW